MLSMCANICHKFAFLVLNGNVRRNMSILEIYTYIYEIQKFTALPIGGKNVYVCTNIWIPKNLPFSQIEECQKKYGFLKNKVIQVIYIVVNMCQECFNPRICIPLFKFIDRYSRYRQKLNNNAILPMCAQNFGYQKIYCKRVWLVEC